MSYSSCEKAKQNDLLKDTRSDCECNADETIGTCKFISDYSSDTRTKYACMTPSDSTPGDYMHENLSVRRTRSMHTTK